jgi:hypothetical protein
MQMFRPLQAARMVAYLPQFVRLFYRLMNDARVPFLAKIVPVLGFLLLLTPPALELDLVPFVGELDWIIIGLISYKIFIWLCPPDIVREHVRRIGSGG